MRAVILFGLMLLGSLSILPGTAFAQREKNFQNWTYHYFLKNLDHEVQFYSDYGYRLQIPPRAFTRFHARPTLRFYYWRRLSFNLGVGFFVILQDDQQDTFEYRGFIGFYFRWPEVTGFYFRWRFRVEAREIFAIGTSEIESSLRIRLKLYFEVPLNNKKVIANTWYLIATAEIFENFGETQLQAFVSELRLEGGGGYRINHHHRVSVVFLLQQAQRGQLDDVPVTNLVFRIRYINYF
ncbi:DUF2490 domain-containing protein [Xanthovirga aplysinae]|uniref:DUF2490 domain-containing protein n=1 Tax=Xanthovirga aplysinae TaxID=2529853 RepID=UPI0012BC0279|nr:DUF2490 domain-containing protein [Xanthovirga aplysinae]MTI31240.1 DUF2490 domain-containing protein [Xanthovirga aplysinae]